jgi:NAD(P)-dependent dehydrogenase (short-subunit alcohol dehydrogenase family)
VTLRGRKMVITGAGRGLGEALAIVAADRGIEPILLGRTAAKLDHVATAIEGRTGRRRPDAIVCDLADYGSIAEAADRIVAAHPDIDILVNSGAQWTGGAYEDQSDEAIEAVVASGVTGTLALTRRLLPTLRARPFADIHTVVSMSGLQYARKRGSSVPFRAAKAAQDGFVHALTEEMIGTNVRVTSIYPGHIEDTSPLEEHSWNADRNIDAALSDRQVVESILFILDMPPGTTIRSLVIERTRTEFLS